MAEYSAIEAQTINPGGSAVFTATVALPESDYIQHYDGTSTFLLSGFDDYNAGCCCPCMRNTGVNYMAFFSANIAVASTGTAGEISVAYSIAGDTDPGSVMQVTPAAVSEFWNVSCAKSISIFRNCCQTVTITNTSDQPIVMQNANLILLPPGGTFN